MAKVMGGLERIAEFGLAHSGINRLYNELSGGPNSFDSYMRNSIYNYHVEDRALGISGDLRDLARQYGLEKQFNEYISKNVIGGLKGNLRRVLDYLTSVKDLSEDVFEGMDTATLGATTPAQPAIYLMTQTVYSILSGILGFSSGIYSKSAKGAVSYLTDVTKGYAGAAVNLVPIIGSIVEIGTNLDDKRHRIAEAGAHQASYWLLNKIRQQLGHPILEEGDLEYKVANNGLLKNLKEKFGKLVDYSSRIKAKNPVYGSDVVPYAHQVYGSA